MTQAAGGTRSAVLAMWVALFAVRVSGFGSPASSGEFCTDWNLAGGLHQSRGKPWPARYNARPDPIRERSPTTECFLRKNSKRS